MPVKKGYKQTDEHRMKRSGQNHWMWKGGVSSLNRKEYLKFKSREWKKKHKDKVQHYNFLYKTRLRNGIFTLNEWNELKKFYKFTCPACYRKEPEITLTKDHIMPLCLGGKNTIDNIQPLCLSCNSRKNKRYIKYDLLIEAKVN